MTEPTSGESLVAILDELTDLVTSARSMPMSASAIVNRAEVLELIESAKGVLPSQIARSEKVIADADAVLARARAEASKTLAKAKERAEALVSEQQVIAGAQARAAEIEQRARESAHTLAREADDYCDRQLAQFEIDLGEIGNQVAAGRARLTERSRSRRLVADSPSEQSAPADKAPTRTSRIDRFRGKDDAAPHADEEQ